MRTRTIALLAMLAAAALAVAAATGCAPSSTGGGGTSGESTQSGIPTAGAFGIISDWTNSSHAVPVTFAAQEQGCAGCHDGRAFAKGVTDPKSLDATFGPYVVATDCRACHTGKAVDILRSGEVTTPTHPTAFKAGTGALCLSCHRERSVPKASDASRTAPHPSVQGSVLLGTGGIRSGNATIGSTVKHQQVTNACVGCHMLNNAQGVPTHTFKPTSPQAACGKCHSGLTTFDRQAKADYDGNGQVQGIQEEVKGLMSLVASAAVAESKATTVTESQGTIVFKSGDTTLTTVSDKAYTGAYNWALIMNDGSFGIHNPRFTVQLLQQTYQGLTGKPVPNGKPYPGSTGATGSGTSTGTSTTP